MVLAAHGVHGVAAECRALCDAGRGGTRLRTLAAVADHFGLTARTRALTPGGFASLALPAIAHWQSRHFVVVERWTRRRAVIVDPATGRQRLTHDEFAAGFSGTALELEARPELVRSVPSRVPLWVWYLAAMFRDTASQTVLVQIVVASLLLQAAGLVAPLFTKLIVDDVGPKNGELSLGLIAAAMATLVVGKCVTTFLRSVLMIRLQTRLDSRLTQGFFEHLLHLPYRFFQGRTSGDLLARLSSNTMIREILTTQLLSFLLDGPFGLLYVIIIAAISPAFALVVGGLAIVQAVLAAVSLGPLRDIGQRTVMAKTDEQSCLVELMKGIGYIKASGVEARAYDRWAALFRRQLDVFVERSYLTAKVDAALGLARSASPLVLLWFGAYLIATNGLPLGTMLALTALAASFLTPVTSLVQNAQQLQLLDAYVERLADVLEAEPEGAVAPRRSRPRATRLAGSVEARDLAYRFAADGPLVVSDVSFTVRPGEKLGIVGATGSGKSTILMLLLGLYRPTAGAVLYDGVPLSELDPREVRQRCGVVLQDSAVFGGSIRSNIEINAPGSSREQLNRASRIAGIADEIAGFPLGYDTRVAEGGSNLSGGQRQRLAIARAVITQPSILLLDEASSHLDVASEGRLIANLERLRCTRIVIAHRLTAVRSASEILVLDHGRIAERGAHHDLIRRGAMYAALAAAQGNAGPIPGGSSDALGPHDPDHLTNTERRVLA
jgi:ABC-type bacteriocin/lantibiotic exporter with double-glycine peptidase domain